MLCYLHYSFVKFLAKPIATRMRAEAAKNPSLKDRFVWCGEMAHEIQTRVNVFAAGYVSCIHIDVGCNV